MNNKNDWGYWSNLEAIWIRDEEPIGFVGCTCLSRGLFRYFFSLKETKIKEDRYTYIHTCICVCVCVYYLFICLFFFPLLFFVFTFFVCFDLNIFLSFFCFSSARSWACPARFHWFSQTSIYLGIIAWRNENDNNQSERFKSINITTE